MPQFTLFLIILASLLASSLAMPPIVNLTSWTDCIRRLPEDLPFEQAIGIARQLLTDFTGPLPDGPLNWASNASASPEIGLLPVERGVPVSNYNLWFNIDTQYELEGDTFSKYTLLSAAEELFRDCFMHGFDGVITIGDSEIVNLLVGLYDLGSDNQGARSKDAVRND